MNRKFLTLALMPLALSLILTNGIMMTNVSASAVIWSHDVGKDSSSQTQTIHLEAFR